MANQAVSWDISYQVGQSKNLSKWKLQPTQEQLVNWKRELKSKYKNQASSNLLNTTKQSDVCFIVRNIHAVTFRL